MDSGEESSYDPDEKLANSLSYDFFQVRTSPSNCSSQLATKTNVCNKNTSFTNHSFSRPQHSTNSTMSRECDRITSTSITDVTKRTCTSPTTNRSSNRGSITDDDDMTAAGRSIQSTKSSASNRSKIEELRKKRMEITKRKNRLPSYQKSYSMESEDMSVGSLQSFGSSASNRSKIEELRKRRMEITKRKNKLQSSIHSSPQFYKSFSIESDDDSFVSRQSLGSPTEGIPISISVQTQNIEVNLNAISNDNRSDAELRATPLQENHLSYSMDNLSLTDTTVNTFAQSTSHNPVQKVNLRGNYPPRTSKYPPAYLDQGSGAKEALGLSEDLSLTDTTVNTFAQSTSHNPLQHIASSQNPVDKNENKHETISKKVQRQWKQVSDDSDCSSLSGKEVLRFGKYKGKTYWHVLRNDSTYSYMTMVDSEQSDNPDIIHFGKWVRDHLAFYCGCEYIDESS